MTRAEFIILFAASVLLFTAFSQLEYIPIISNIIIYFFSAEFIEAVSKILAETTWPFAFIFVALIFKKELISWVAKLLDGDIKVTKGDFALTIKKQQNAESANPSLQKFDPNLNEEDERLSLTPTPTQEKLELLPIVKKYLELLKSRMENSARSTGMQPQEWLEASLVETHIALSFERIYQWIYGSQISALQHLEVKGYKASLDAIKVFYTLAAANSPAIYKSDSFERWVSYLIKENLISMENDQFVLNLEGSEFLRYIRQRNYYLNKAL